MKQPEICRKTLPVLRTLGGKSGPVPHQVACHLAE
jgi:hypothetical protein